MITMTMTTMIMIRNTVGICHDMLTSDDDNDNNDDDEDEDDDDEADNDDEADLTLMRT